MGWQVIMISGLIRDLLTKHFASPLTVRDRDLRRAVWSAGADTGILVESVYRWDGTTTGTRPAVLVKQNRRRRVRFAMANRAGLKVTGNYEFAQLWVGSHTVFCVHGTGAGAEILATEVQRQLTGFAQVLVDQLGLHRFEVLEVGDPAEIEEAREGWASPVVVGWAYEERWAIEVESLKIRSVNLSMIVDGAVLQ